MSGRPLRAGVVGLGWAGQQHMAAYADLPGVELVALAGLRGRAAEPSWGTSSGSRPSSASTTGRTWSASAELDVLSIATPTTLHAPIAIAALDAGRARAVGEADGRERRGR